MTNCFPSDFPQGVRTPNTTERAKREPPKKRKGPSIPRTIHSEAVVNGGPKDRPTEVIDASSKTRALRHVHNVCAQAFVERHVSIIFFGILHNGPYSRWLNRLVQN